jgi:glyoxylase-like metal-dependent hydrolase (beta-lactamase superfamily II)
VSQLELISIPNGQFAQNCYLLLAPNRDAVLVDPGEEWETFLTLIGKRQAKLGAIWLTHAHFDHILGVGDIHRETGAPIWLHPGDRSLYDGLPQQGLWLGLRAAPPPAPSHALAHGLRLTVGETEFEVRHTPGHSPGSVSFVGAGVVLSGDALFAGSIGRSDLPGGDHDRLIQSIRSQLLTLDDETRVLSGHGPETTIGTERRNNPFLKDLGLGT